MNKAVFLDKDGTLVDDSCFPKEIPSDKILWDDVEKGLHYLQDQGYLLIIISNQGWIGTKRATYDQIDKHFQSVVKQLKEKGITITAYYFCPHATKDNCHCRKPSPFFVQEAAKKFKIDLTQSYFIGDTDKDIDAGKNAGIKTILVKKHPAIVF